MVPSAMFASETEALQYAKISKVLVSDYVPLVAFLFFLKDAGVVPENKVEKLFTEDIGEELKTGVPEIILKLQSVELLAIADQNISLTPLGEKVAKKLYPKKSVVAQ